MVSENTPRACSSPCFIGCDVDAMAAALGAEPSPASLLKSPRFTPCITAAPNIPPTACSSPKALLTMRANIAGICVTLRAMMMSEMMTKPIAINGTTMLAKCEMRVIPPKMMTRVATVTATPIHILSIPDASASASHSVLLCTTWFAMPNVMVISTANNTPIHRR